MNWRDYIPPVITGILSIIVLIVFRNTIVSVIQTSNFSEELFTVFSLLFGLVLTSYSMFFGVLPVIKKDIRSSDDMRNINFYFKSCLMILLVGIISSLIFLFYSSYYILAVTLTILGISIGFFYEIVILTDVFWRLTS